MELWRQSDSGIELDIVVHEQTRHIMDQKANGVVHIKLDPDVTSANKDANVGEKYFNI